MGKERSSPRQQVPEEMAAMLRGLRDAKDRRLNMVLDAAHRNGWVHAALAEVLGMSAEGIRRRIASVEYFAAPLPPFPLPPRRANQHKAPTRSRLSLPADLVAELQSMRDRARTVNGVTPDDDPRREVSRQFTSKLAALHEQGVSLYALAKALDVNINTVRFRLARHNYIRPAPSMVGNVYGKGHPQRRRSAGDAA
jgi:C4-dicarboxylate-specific signal transduction histidine kinase